MPSDPGYYNNDDEVPEDPKTVHLKYGTMTNVPQSDGSLKMENMYVDGAQKQGIQKTITYS